MLEILDQRRGRLYPFRKSMSGKNMGEAREHRPVGGLKKKSPWLAKIFHEGGGIL